MEADPSDDAIHHIIAENQKLKKRVFELEEKLRSSASHPHEQKDAGSAVRKLIEHKDFQLEQYSARLQEKKEQLESISRELEDRNAQLALWNASLRLFQDIFENDASAMVGVNPDGRVILYNRTAPQLLGEKFKEALHKPIEAVEFQAFDPLTAKKVRDALATRRAGESSVVVRDRRIQTSIQPVGSAAEPRGALIRIQVFSTK